MVEKIVFGGGCFWCVEAIFQRIKGVKEVMSGYAGGVVENPSYEEVSDGGTGHIEAVEVLYDPVEIKLKDILYIFFRTHDPTSFDKQGADVGEQYRSVIFYGNEEQRKESERAMEEAQKEYKERIVTKILPLKRFYKAEEYHQNYYNRNREASYCRIVIDPKITKLMERYGKYVKKEV